MTNATYGFAGLGLIGGSIAKALREKYPHCTIIVYDADPGAMELARFQGTADIQTDCLDHSFAPCDFLFLCAPVSFNDQNLARLHGYLSKDCLITDVGSVKTPIHRTVAQLDMEDQFIGGHPMTGSERTGYANAKAGLLENAYYILTPASRVSPGRLESFRQLIGSLGALPIVLTYEEHDYVTAAVSHLPHIVAASLVHLIRDTDSKEGIMKMIAAGGFKDMTRIASSSPVMWQQICLSNPENIGRLLEQYINALISIREEIRTSNGDALYRFFEHAGKYRDTLPDPSSGPIRKSYTVYVDIPDRTGTLASIAALLADHAINIKNIGITHNREQEYGALMVEFYDEASFRHSVSLFTDSGYVCVHSK